MKNLYTLTHEECLNAEHESRNVLGYKIKKNIHFYTVRLEHSNTVDFGLYYINPFNDFCWHRLMARKINLCALPYNMVFTDYLSGEYGYFMLSSLADSGISIWEPILISLENCQNTKEAEEKEKRVYNKYQELTGGMVRAGSNDGGLFFVLTGNFMETEEQNIKERIESLKMVSVYGKEEEPTNRSALKIGKPEKAYMESDKQNDDIKTLSNNPEEQLSVRVEFASICERKEIYSAVLLSSILGEGDGSWLNMQLRESFAYTDEVETGIFTEDETLCIQICFLVKRRYLNDALDIVRKTSIHMEENLTEQDLEEVRLFYTEVQNRWYNDSYSLNQKVGISFVCDDWEGFDIEMQEENYRKVSLHDIKQIAKKILTEKNCKIIVT